MHLHRLFLAFALMAALQFVPGTARAAQGYANCTGFIDTAPATISTQGVYCLRHDLSTNVAYGAAIRIAANNVTLDCNDFKLGGLAAGQTTGASGVSADGQQNVTVRNCNIRGYAAGISLVGAGHLVEDNRLDNNLGFGIYVDGDRNLVRRNRVYDTGSKNSVVATGIRGSADIVDNIVDGVFATQDSVGTHTIVGIQAVGMSARVERNRVGGLQPYGAGNVYGIAIANRYMTVAANNIVATTLAAGSVGIRGLHVEDGGQVATVTFCAGNTVGNFASAASDCSSNGGANYSL